MQIIRKIAGSVSLDDEKRRIETSRGDHFYHRLAFYRLLEAGRGDLAAMAQELLIPEVTLRRWQKTYDSGQGPFGGNKADKNVCPSLRGNEDREEILWALRRTALEGNVPAAKLLLTEYETAPIPTDEILTVDRALELLREWNWDQRESGSGIAQSA